MKLANLGLNLMTKRKWEVLIQMERVVAWSALTALIALYAREGSRGRPPFAVQTMLCMHFRQQWFTLSDPAMEEALHEVPLLREFAGLNWGTAPPDEATFLRFRRLLEEHKLAPQILVLVNELLGAQGLLMRAYTVVDATLIAAPRSTKSASGARDPQIKQSENGNHWYFGMKVHIGVAADWGLVGTVRGTACSVNDVVQANTPLHGGETDVWGDASYQGAGHCTNATHGVRWNIAMRPGKRKLLDRNRLVDDLIDQIEHIKASIRVKVEHSIRLIMRRVSHVTGRYRELAKSTATLQTLFALSNLWMVRRTLMGVQA